jgi:HK97 family phage portal protein
VLEEGITWAQVGMTADDAQFLDTRKFQVSEIARAFRVPPHMIGDLERATFSNIEHQAIEFVVHTLTPWLVCWEQAIKRDLLSVKSFSTHDVKFVVNGLLRGDIASRYQAYATGRQWGWLSANDVRALEDQNPLDGDQGDMYLTPVNMADASEPLPAQASDAPRLVA